MASTAAATDRAQGMAATDNALHETIGTPNCYWLDHRARRKGAAAIWALRLYDFGSVALDY